MGVRRTRPSRARRLIRFLASLDATDWVAAAGLLFFAVLAFVSVRNALTYPTTQP